MYVYRNGISDKIFYDIIASRNGFGTSGIHRRTFPEKKSLDASAYFGAGVGSEFEAYPLPSSRLGDSSTYTAFSSAA
jgi:hypothetical protein